MPVPYERKVGAIGVIAGSLSLAAYGALFPFLLPMTPGSFDYVQVVSSRWWMPLSTTAFIGVLLLVVGFEAVWSRLRPTTGAAGWIGFICLKIALVLQACKLTWELFLDPIIGGHPDTAFLLRDLVIFNDPAVVAFRAVSAATIVIGVVLFGVTLYRSGEFPKRAPVLIAVGSVVYAIGAMITVWFAIAGIVTLSLGCILLGIRLWENGAAAAPTRV